MKNALVSYAPTVWKLLNGVICVFKPAGETVNRVRNSLLGKLSRELCELDCRPPEPYVLVEGDTTKQMKVSVFPSFADNPLVVGPRYQASDFICTWSTILGINTSGVLVFGLNQGTKKVHEIHKSRPLRTYHITGSFGQATDNLYTTGKVIETKSFRHVRRNHLEKLLANIQSSHQRIMFELCGVDLQSQAAYELAVSGLIRPANSKLPLIYGIKCIDFNPPQFTIEVHCINEYESYLMALILSIGMKLRSVATCTAVRCVRHSYFTLDEALLKKHWTLENVIENISICKKLITEHEKLPGHLQMINQKKNIVNKLE